MYILSVHAVINTVYLSAEDWDCLADAVGDRAEHCLYPGPKKQKQEKNNRNKRREKHKNEIRNNKKHKRKQERQQEQNNERTTREDAQGVSYVGKIRMQRFPFLSRDYPYGQFSK